MPGKEIWLIGERRVSGECRYHPSSLPPDTSAQDTRRHRQGTLGADLFQQKNGAVVHRIVGYRRLKGIAAAAALARLYTRVGLFVNFFQPSFKLAGKEHDGAQVRKPHLRLCRRQRVG